MIIDNKLVFRIEQIAIAPSRSMPGEARKLLREIGANEWSSDTVEASGSVFGVGCDNAADLEFNYQICEGKEFEVLHYHDSMNWLSYSAGESPTVSHFGMHCDAQELKLWKAFFAKRNIRIAQEVITNSHTNPAIKDTRPPASSPGWV